MDVSEQNRWNSIQGMLMRIFHKYTSVNYKQFQNQGVHPGQLSFIKAVSAHEGISQRELAEKLHVKPPTVAVTVKRLEKAEVIYRRPDPDDLRVSRIYLAEKGKVISKDILRVIDENEKILTDGFTESELEQLGGYLQRMLENLDRMRENGNDVSTEK